MILASIFRDAGNYVHRYVEQVKKLRELVPAKVIVAEGDSFDYTYDQLCSYDEFTVLKVEHGGPAFRSVDHPLRWRQIAAVGNVVLAAAVREMHDEPIVYVESDLIWEPDTIVRLAALTDRYPAVATMSMKGDRFYDVWGTRKSGLRFHPQPPYHPELGDEITEVDSAGSCFALSPTAALVAQFSPIDCILGIGRSLRDNGLGLYLDPSLSVEHP